MNNGTIKVVNMKFLQKKKNDGECSIHSHDFRVSRLAVDDLHGSLLVNAESSKKCQISDTIRSNAKLINFP
ncbi:hypothetical protein YC2023_005165 [Brassica napus]